jgi:hypothetical protein
MTSSVEDLKELQAETIGALGIVAKNQKKISDNQKIQDSRFDRCVNVLDESGQRIESYRVSIGPSIEAVAGKLESAAQKQVDAAKINSESMKAVINRMEAQEERHREERNSDLLRQDARDERFFDTVENLTEKVEENSKISLETSHQVTVLTQAVTDQCRANDETRKANQKTQEHVQALEVSMAVAKTKWAIVGSVAGALAAAVVGLLFKILGTK